VYFQSAIRVNAPPTARFFLNLSVKRISAFVTLTILLVNAAGFYVYYAAHLHLIKAEMFEALRETPVQRLEKVSMPLAEFVNSKEDENEVEVNGKMFDIAKIVISGQTVVLYGMTDKEETNLLGMLEEVLGKPVNNSYPVPTQVLQFMTLIFLKPDGNITLSLPSQAYEHNRLYQSLTRNIFIPTNYPPPEASSFQS
jgi:hypothetical protein